MIGGASEDNTMKMLSYLAMNKITHKLHTETHDHWEEPPLPHNSKYAHVYKEISEKDYNLSMSRRHTETYTIRHWKYVVEYHCTAIEEQNHITNIYKLYVYYVLTLISVALVQEKLHFTKFWRQLRRKRNSAMKYPHQHCTISH